MNTDHPDEPAFPSVNDVNVGNYVTGGHPGMTLRDYFAAKAMVCLCTMVAGDMQDVTSNEDLAIKAYAMADAMLKARQS